MHPILFHIGPVPIYAYAAFGALAFLTLAVGAMRRGARVGIPGSRIADVAVVAGSGAVVGARVAYVLTHPDQFPTPGTWLDLRGGGLVFYGGLVALVPLAAAMIAGLKLPFFAVADAFAVGLPLAHAIARIGCFMAGCCYGAPSDLPWAVTFSDPHSVGPLHVASHPTQLYEAIGLVAIAVGTGWVYRHKRRDGQAMLAYLLGYAVLRAALDPLRGERPLWFLESWLGPHVTIAQAGSGVVALVAVLVFHVAARRWASARVTASIRSGDRRASEHDSP